jgi:hypothetical protein
VGDDDADGEGADAASVDLEREIAATAAAAPPMTTRAAITTAKKRRRRTRAEVLPGLRDESLELMAARTPC